MCFFDAATCLTADTKICVEERGRTYRVYKKLPGSGTKGKTTYV